jgi:hypothetical protein
MAGLQRQRKNEVELCAAAANRLRELWIELDRTGIPMLPIAKTIWRRVG